MRDRHTVRHHAGVLVTDAALARAARSIARRRRRRRDELELGSDAMTSGSPTDSFGAIAAMLVFSSGTERCLGSG